MRITLDTTYIPCYNAYSGQTETMQAKWANLKKWKKKPLQRLLWEKQISANLILLLKTGRIRVVIVGSMNYKYLSIYDGARRKEI